MTFVPMRARALGTQPKTLFVNDSGRFFAGSDAFVERLLQNEPSDAEFAFLRSEGHWLDDDDALGRAAHSRSVARRFTIAGPLDYLILVPTLRCNLSCSYCQVSRVNAEQQGFDWSEETLAAVLHCLDQLPAERIKIEFQGGEATLRPDLIRAVMERTSRFRERQFVICTNLQSIDDEVLAIFDCPEVFISTSLDGDSATHHRNRTHHSEKTDQFFYNLRFIVDRYGPRKVSALPTIDSSAPPAVDDIIDAYLEYGLDSIFLRPINYQGFARKRHKSSREQGAQWRAYYESFVRRIIERNWEDRDRVFEETYLSIGLRRIFRPGVERHVDLRNPNLAGHDYIVIDYDGTIYPTDEARMLARSGVVDLAIGTVQDGWDSETRTLLNQHATNQFDPDCQKCVYQPFCGRDIVDDLARYGRIGLPRHETEFCRRHMHLFDFIFELIYSDCPKIRYSIGRWLRLPTTPLAIGQIIP